MAQLGEGEKVAFNPTEFGSGVHLFNSSGALTSLQLETPRVHICGRSQNRERRNSDCPSGDLNSGSRSDERSESTVFLWFTIPANPTRKGDTPDSV